MLGTMAVFVGTVHAYRSWREDDPRGHVQRGEGLRKPNASRAKWRAEHARNEPARFDRALQEIFVRVVEEIIKEFDFRLHAQSATRTHLHVLMSFRSPACTCGASKYCLASCPARQLTEKYLARLKRKLGQAAAKHHNTKRRPWLSRGWDITPVRNRDHFNYLVEEYLPKHAIVEQGIVRVYP
jgi:hypothetical protein